MKLSSLRIVVLAIACLLPLAVVINFHVISTSYSHLSSTDGGKRGHITAPHGENSGTSVSTSTIADRAKAALPSGAPVTKRKRVAYAITVTKDGHFVDGALVLGHSALRVHNASKGFVSQYDADLVAFVAPTVVTARSVLQAYGWKILERGLPVPLGEIENQVYANHMKESGCCGADEFLKLWAYTLIEYERVVHLDMDSMITGNMDELYTMEYEMLFTGDWNMRGSSPVPPAQGGFLVIRPSLETFRELQAIIRKGDHGSGGWGGSGIGNFWGGQTIQGIVPYFYHSVHKGQGLELNRCVYNCMVDNPYRPNTNICLDKTGKTCQDCRLQKIENVKSAHFTICQKPWTCTEHTNPKNRVLCAALHSKWFMLRDELETETGVDKSYRLGPANPNRNLT